MSAQTKSPDDTCTLTILPTPPETIRSIWTSNYFLFYEQGVSETSTYSAFKCDENIWQCVKGIFLVCVCVIGKRNVRNDSEKSWKNSRGRFNEYRSSLTQHNHKHFSERTLRKSVWEKHTTLFGTCILMNKDAICNIVHCLVSSQHPLCTRMIISSRRSSEVTLSQCTNWHRGVWLQFTFLLSTSVKEIDHALGMNGWRCFLSQDTTATSASA